MTTHELATQLLAGPNLPVRLQVNTNTDGAWGAAGDVRLKPEGDTVTLFAYSEQGEDAD